jgi:TRAP transporter 4TM/12TM fusion protein
LTTGNRETEISAPRPVVTPDRLEDELRKLVFVCATGLSLFQLWQSMTASIGATYSRPIHLTWVMTLVFLYHPSRRGGPRGYRFLDIGLAALSLLCGWSITTFDYGSIDHLLHGLTLLDLVAGTLFLALLFEATRRTVGFVMVAIGLLFLLYNAYGNLLPDALANRGFSLERIVRFQVYTDSGVFGIPLGIAVGTVFIFVLFGAFLEVTGAGQFFIDLAFAVAGRFRGGPAKASVIASAALGSISGSAIANAVTTGAFTIPMMKKLGYRPEQAAGVEAAASTGGQIMPPIMGAGAFIMAEFTNTPYKEIVAISIVPALLYFATTLLFVHLMAVRLDLSPMPERPRFRTTFREGYHFLLPLVLVTVLLLLDYSPPIVGTLGSAAVIVAGFLSPRTRVGLRLLLEGLKQGALIVLPISLACATAGIVVGVIGQTGAGLQFTESVVDMASGHLWLALVLITIASVVLGMGLPATAAYIVISVVAAPALSDLGLPLLVAHMILFWLAQTSNVTPPIALAAFAAAGIAGARPLRTAVEALKLSAGFFLIPAMMAYSSLLKVEGVSFGDMLYATALTLVLVGCVAVAAEGYAIAPLRAAERAGFLVAAGLVLYPSESARLVGLAVGGLSLALHVGRVRGLRAAAPLPEPGKQED